MDKARDVTRERPRRRGPRGDLSVALVLDAATLVLERDGLRTFSMRSVARELGVAPNALYTYAESREVLLELLADRALGELDRGSLASGATRADIVDFAELVLSQLIGRPALARLLFEEPIGGPASHGLNEALIAAIHRCGPTIPVAARVAHALTALVFGHAMIEVGDSIRTRWPDPPDAEQHPLTVAAAVPVPEIPNVFRWSVEALLAGCGC
ncbi:TetR/AcrR family transcriptional regulator [Luteococcus sanguinis]|uniref:TetR/AcrR family transcriptional regulator n=1 Tax=Luteococcus sanguinis TaxID=174038 RepID=A0ABW1X211_9ACTN